MRACWLIAAIGVAGFHVSDQIQDTLVTAAFDWAFAQWFWFLCSVFLWAFAGWFWARLLVQHRRPVPRGLPPAWTANRVKQAAEPLAVWGPRAIGALIIVGVAAAWYRAGIQIWHARSMAPPAGQIAGFAACLAIWIGFVVGRRRISNWLADRARGMMRDYLRIEHRPLFDTLTFEQTLRRARWWIVGLLAASAGLAVASFADATAIGHGFGPENVITLAFTSMTIGLSFIILWTDRIHFPVLLALLLAAGVFSLWLDNHALRALPGSASQPRPTIAAAASDFIKTRPPGTKLLVVATAGGGMRAAYWTASILGRMHDAGVLENNLFAISSVSGGSYGAAVYRALLQSTRKSADPKCTAVDAKTSFTEAARRILSEDALGPTLANMLFVDLPQRFLPISLTDGNDRAAAIEIAWEHAWRKVVKDGCNTMAGPLDRLWTEGGAVPALFLNGTSVAGGRRLITSTLALQDSTPPCPTTAAADAKPRRFPDALDLQGLSSGRLAVSTAAYTSARFPIVGAPGTVMCNGKPVDQVVDGGYWENFGAGTALDLIAALRGLPGAPEVVMLQISSDPDLPPRDAMPAPVEPIDVASEVRTPVTTLLATRSARGFYATGLSNRELSDANYFELRMTSNDHAPLGWVLSAHAMCDLDDEWANNAKELERLYAALGWGKPAAARRDPRCMDAAHQPAAR